MISGLFLFVIFLLVWRIHTALTTYHITAKFKEMKPLPHHIQVLYKGLKIGNVISVKHSDDLEYTLIKLRLPKKIKLPHNVIANLMIEKRRFYDYDYIELVKPESTSEECLTSNSEIGNIKENINISMKGKDIFIAFNARYFMEALRTNSDEFIKINFSSQIAPCTICSAEEDKYLYLILPVRIVE